MKINMDFDGDESEDIYLCEDNQNFINNVILKELKSTIDDLNKKNEEFQCTICDKSINQVKVCGYCNEYIHFACANKYLGGCLKCKPMKKLKDEKSIKIINDCFYRNYEKNGKKAEILTKGRYDNIRLSARDRLFMVKNYQVIVDERDQDEQMCES
jgi:hypothetical protein